MLKNDYSKHIRMDQSHILFRKERITPVVMETEQNMPKYLVRVSYEQRRRKIYGNIILCSIAKLIAEWIHLENVPWLNFSKKIFSLGGTP